MKNFAKNLRLATSLLLVFAAACAPANHVTNNYTSGPDAAGKNAPTSSVGPGGGGTGDGGGGQVISCSKDAKIASVQGKTYLRDVYEALVDSHRVMKAVPGNSAAGTSEISKEAVRVLVDSLRVHYGPASANLKFVNDEFWLGFVKKISFIDSNYDLQLSTDASSPIALPVGCTIQQAAYWQDSAGIDDSGTLYIKKDIWDGLDQLNKVALLAHEIFYKQARSAGFKNSDFTRYKIGQLLSTEGLLPIFESWEPNKNPVFADLVPDSPRGFKFCKGLSDEDPSAELQYYQYQGKDKLQHFVLPYLKSNLLNLALLQNKNFSFDPAKGDDLASVTDLMIFGTDFLNNSCGALCQDAIGSPSVLAAEPDTQLPIFLKKDTWFDLWYAQENFISANLSNDNFNRMRRRDALVTTLSILGNTNKSVIWTNFVPNGSNTFKISILNPAIGYIEPTKALLPPENLISEINRLLREDIKMSNRLTDWTTQEMNQRLEGTMAALNQEISEAIQAGTYPYNFPRWKTSLVDLMSHMKNDLNRNPDLKILNHVDDNLINADLPMLLFKIKSNNYNERDFDHLHYVAAIEPGKFLKGDHAEASNTISPVRMRIQDAKNSELSFNLSCEDYTETISKKVSKRNTILDNSMPPRSTDLKYEIDRASYRGSTEKYLSLLSQMLDGIIYANNGSAMTSQTDSICRTTLPTTINDFNCLDFLRLQVELSEEKLVKVVSCTDLSEHLVNYVNEKAEQGTSCAILKLTTVNSAYLIHTTSGKEYPLDFIRLIPSH